MARYRSIPVEVDALQLTKETVADVEAFDAGEWRDRVPVFLEPCGYPGYLMNADEALGEPILERINEES